MSEQTDKGSQGSGKATATKRPPRKTRSPRTKTAARKQDPGNGKSAKSQKAAGPEVETAGSLAPDPATVVFGSNRPIVAPPPPKPVSSGLRFAGPSAGALKASGPQATSAKAEGLTFAATAAEESKQPPAQAKGGKPNTTKPGTKTPPETKTTESTAKAKPNPAKVEPGKAKTVKADPSGDKAPQKPAVATKPAIAPQHSGPRIEKTPSRRPATYALLGIAAAAGLALWLGNRPAVDLQPGGPELAALPEPDGGGNPLQQPGAGAETQPAESPTAAPDVASAGNANAAAPTQAPGADSVTIAELWEIQDILRQLDLGPGASSGEMTAATRDAIRSYQEMAGLAATGEASPALLKELRAVAALYSGG